MGRCRKTFLPIHPPNILSHLPPEAHLGPIDPETLPREAFEATEEELRIAKAREELPDPSAALNLQDIEVRAGFLFGSAAAQAQTERTRTLRRRCSRRRRGRTTARRATMSTVRLSRVPPCESPG